MIDVSTCSPEMERLRPYSAIMTAVLRYTQHHHRASAHKQSCIPSNTLDASSSCISSVITHWTQPVQHIINILDATSPAYHQHTGHHQSCMSSHTGHIQSCISSTHWTQPVLHIINTLDTTSPAYHHTLDTTSPAYHQHTVHNQSCISSHTGHNQSCIS